MMKLIIYYYGSLHINENYIFQNTHIFFHLYYIFQKKKFVKL